MKIQQAVATSSACGLPIAIAGAIGFIITGWNEVNLPENSLGYVYWPGFISIVISSMIFAPIGAWVAHKISAGKLRSYFSLILFLLGLRMLLS